MMTEKGKWQSSLMRLYRGFAENYIDGILPGRGKFCRKGILPGRGKFCRKGILPGREKFCRKDILSGRQEIGGKEEEVSA